MKTISFYALLILIECLIWIVQLQATQEIKFRYFKTEDGLASNTVNCVLQDSRGYIWFGTGDGLTRYDSYEFTTYRSDSNDPGSIGSNTIYSLYEDREGILWIGTDIGLYNYDAATDSFKAILLAGDTPLLVNSIAEDNTSFWLATLGGGVFRYDKATRNIYNYHYDEEDPQSLGSDYAPKILVDDFSDVWCITSGSNLYKYDRIHDTFQSIPIHDSRYGITESNAFSMCEDYLGNLWIAGWDSGVFCYNKSTGKFRNYLTKNGVPLLKGRIHIIREIEPGRFMLGSDSGLTSFEPETGEYHTYSYQQNTERSLSDNFVYDVCRDREGGLWVATYFGGVNYLSPNNAHFSSRQCNISSGRGRIISKFCEDSDGRIWIGTDDGGLFQYNSRNDQLNPVILDPQTPALNIHALLVDGDNLWVGTYSNGLYRMNTRNRENVEHFLRFSDRSGDWNESVYSLYKDGTGTLWIGTKTGIYTYDRDHFTCIAYLGYNSDIVSICGDSQGALWFASINHGILRYDPQTRRVSANIRLADGSIVPLPRQIRTISFYKNRLWIGTAGYGLFYYDVEDDTYAAVPLDFESANLTVLHIIPENDNLWITTSLGLIRYSISSGKVSRYNYEDGLLSNSFNPNSGLHASDGYIYLGTNGGFNFFNPESLQPNQVPPPVVFTSFHIHGQPVGIGSSALSQHINIQRHITLKGGQSAFAISFAALSYCASPKNRYRYHLEGYDSQWYECGYKNNQVAYNDLPAGTYTFYVVASNNDGMWGNPEKLTIVVQPYWWASHGAIIFYILFFSSCCILVYRLMRSSYLQKQQARIEQQRYEREKERTDAEIEFFTNIAHEIRTPVTLITAPTNEILAKKGLPQEVTDLLHLIKRSSDRLLNLANEILNFRKKSLTVMFTTPTDIVAYTQQVIDSFRLLAEEHKIELIFTLQGGGKSDDAQIMASINQEAYSKILSNLLTNALKFTRNRILVKLVINDQNFEVQVEDNGIGIKKEELENIFYAFRHYDKPANVSIPGFGLGLSIASMLARKMNAEIHVASELGVFTRFTAIFPLSSPNGEKATKIEEQSVETKPAETDIQNISSSHEDSNPHPETSATILLVEDDPDLLAYMEKSLRHHYSILTACDGVKAFEVIGLHSIDVIISDVLMPHMNGIELCKRLKDEVNFCHIPVILLSANASLSTKTLGLEGGADVYIEKPVDMDFLIVQINSLLEKRRMLWDVFSKRPLIPISSISQTTTDEVFLNRLTEIIESNLSNPQFAVEDLAQMIYMSRSVLYVKMKNLFGMTPNNFIKLIRLRRAAQYLIQGVYKVNEICYLVGFNTPSYFAKCFQEQFGVLPKDFAAQQKTEKAPLTSQGIQTKGTQDS